LLSRNALDVVVMTLSPEHFYSQANARIFQAIQQLALASAPVDVVSVAGWLRDREWLQKMGGTPYLAELADATPAVGHVAAHARVVHRKWRLRMLIATCQRVFAEGYGDVSDEDAFIKIAAEAVDEIAQGGEARKQLVPVRESLQEAFTQITAAAERGDRITGVPTGYTRLDVKTAGLHDGDLVIVAARPGMGKTSFVLNIATNVASARQVQVPATAERAAHERIEPGLGVCVFSLEMPREQLATRLVCSEGRVDLGRLRQGHLHADDWRKLTEAGSYLSTLPIWIDDTPALSLLELRAKVRRQQAAFDREATDDTPARRVGLVAVDYLQLMKGRDGVNSREQEISEISRGLKALAKELKVPVIALSQLNRAVETRSTKDKRPQLSDLRESGAIEQDADTIIFITRPEYYDPDTDMKGIADLDIAKQRNGPTGRIKLRFTAACTRFDNLEPGDHPEEADE
jgi:replicative DNA helicase